MIFKAAYSKIVKTRMLQNLKKMLMGVILSACVHLSIIDFPDMGRKYGHACILTA